ncbi:hypothetical protein GWI33_008511 [Rhynchophorus ferrugineus]|uniref:Uncharacterized protein n=1 Tax=Rhynchophorus ferrugineus TaxID=354439 RepID=A0A834IQZ1_RHYFE|nr:hypothetical protein GWI33_008511 [Rhynchophorus ferrugineus]
MKVHVRHEFKNAQPLDVTVRKKKKATIKKKHVVQKRFIEAVKIRANSEPSNICSAEDGESRRFSRCRLGERRLERARKNLLAE